MYKISDKQYEDIINSYINGESSVSLARRYGISRERVCQYLREIGVERRGIKTKLTQNEIVDIIKNYKNIPAYKIAKKYNTTSAVIKRVLKENNIHIRTHSEATTLAIPLWKKALLENPTKYNKWKKNISIGMKGKPSHRKGKKLSLETRKKMSIAAKKRHRKIKS